MKNTPSARPEAKESSSSPVMSIVLYTTLVSAVASLIVGILALIKRRQPTLPGRSAGAPADDQDQLLETSYRAATYPAIGRISLPEEPQRMEQHAPKTTAVSSEAGELAMSQPANGILDQAVEAQLAPGKPAQSTRWSLPTKYVVGVGLFLALLFVVFISRSSLGMIIFAALLAFVAQPAINFFQRRWKMKRGSAIGSSLSVGHRNHDPDPANHHSCRCSIHQRCPLDGLAIDRAKYGSLVGNCGSECQLDTRDRTCDRFHPGS